MWDLILGTLKCLHGVACIQEGAKLPSLRLLQRLGTKPKSTSNPTLEVQLHNGVLFLGPHILLLLIRTQEPSAARARPLKNGPKRPFCYLRLGSR